MFYEMIDAYWQFLRYDVVFLITNFIAATSLQ